MPSTRLRTTKNGQQYYEIRVSRGRGMSYLCKRWYVPEGWSVKAIERELRKQSAAFERLVKSGEIISRSEEREREEERIRSEAAIKTVKQVGESLYMASKRLSVSENTRAFYQNQLDQHIYPAIGSIKVTEVTPAQINALLLKLQEKKLSHSSVIAVFTTLNQLFETAYMSDMIERNPMDKVSRPRQTKEKLKDDAVEAYTAEEINYILECLENESLKWRAYIRLLIDSGMRKGEACALKWNRVNFDDGTITICENLCYTKSAGVYTTTPKSGKSRTIDVDPDVMNLLRQLLASQRVISPTGYVFTQDGSLEPMNPQSPTRYLERFGKKYGIEHLHPHKLRHSFASIALTNNADLISVSKKLGHANAAITAKVYAHSNAEAIKKAGDIFRDVLKQKHA